jgi:hypothetical protein
LVEGPWNAAFIDEFAAFPEGGNDDQIDAVANAYTHLSGRKGLRAAIGRSSGVKAAQEKIKATGNESEVPKAKKSGATFGRRKIVRPDGAQPGEFLKPDGTAQLSKLMRTFK